MDWQETEGRRRAARYLRRDELTYSKERESSRNRRNREEETETDDGAVQHDKQADSKGKKKI